MENACILSIQLTLGVDERSVVLIKLWRWVTVGCEDQQHKLALFKLTVSEHLQRKKHVNYFLRCIRF